MKSSELIGLNTKWYRYQNNMTQIEFSNKTKFSMAYISNIENGNTNLTCKNIEVITKALSIKTEALFDETTALKAKKLPKKVSLYKRTKKQ